MNRSNFEHCAFLSQERDDVDARFETKQGLAHVVDGGQVGGRPDLGQARLIAFGLKRVRAWNLGTLNGYTFGDVAWQPRIGLQMDAASGNRSPNDNTLGTFNPLFPNGYYVTLSGYTGDTNVLHFKPSLSIAPVQGWKVLGAVGLLWRETTADAVYLQPDIPVRGTAGTGSQWTAVYGQLRADCIFDAHLTGAVEINHYAVGETIRQAGGHDSDYVAVELKFQW